MLACGSKSDATGGASGAKALRIGMVPKGGAPVEVLWKAPIREDDREQQVEVVEGLISQGVSGLGAGAARQPGAAAPVISSDQYAGAARDTAKRASENRLNRFAEGQRDLHAERNLNRRHASRAAGHRQSAASTFVGFDYSRASSPRSRRAS